MANYYKEINKIIDKTLYKLYLIDKKGFDLGLKGQKFSFIEMYIIKEIKKKPGQSIYNLVKETDIDRSTIAASVNKLVLGGYLRKEKSKVDKRIFLLELTESGEVVFDKIILQQGKTLEFILNDVTLNEEKAILKFLSKVNQTML